MQLQKAVDEVTGAGLSQNNDEASAPRNARQQYPSDRFDEVPRSGRVGAHRVIARPRYIWQYLIAGLLGFALLTTIGVLWVGNIGASNAPAGGSTPTSTTGPKKAPKAEIDPEATVAVLNGTEVAGLEVELDKIITEEKWGELLFSGTAATDDVKISAVFYDSEEHLAAAAGLAAELGGLSTYQTDDYLEYQAQLVVLLGADYSGPGLEEAEKAAKKAKKEAREQKKREKEAADQAEQSGVNPETGNPIDPATGYDIDPQTNQLIDPRTGWLIDPATGLAVNPATGLPEQPVG